MTLELAVESPIELILIKEILKRPRFMLGKPSGQGWFVRSQYPIGPYEADFLITACGYKNTQLQIPMPRYSVDLAIECDGHDYHTSPEQINHDKKRDRYFASHGIKTVRFTGSEIFKNTRDCVEEIETILWWHMDNH